MSNLHRRGGPQSGAAGRGRWRRGDREDRREHMWLVEGGGPAARKEGAGAGRQAGPDGLGRPPKSARKVSPARKPSACLGYTFCFKSHSHGNLDTS